MTGMYLAKIPGALFLGRWLLGLSGRASSNVSMSRLVGLVFLLAASYLPFGLGFLGGFDHLVLGVRCYCLARLSPLRSNHSRGCLTVGPRHVPALPNASYG